MGYVYLGIPLFFILKFRFLILYFCFAINYIANATTEVNSLLINKKHILELVITDLKLANLGSWMFFMSNNLDEASKIPIAGIEGVGHKIEGGRLSRYENSYENKWRDLGPVKIVKNTHWQSIVIPKEILFKNAGEKEWTGNIHWRLVLFPHHLKTAVFIPHKSHGTLNLKDQLNSGAATPFSINFSHFYDYSKKDIKNILTFGDGVLSSNVFQKENKLKISNINYINSALNEVQKHSVWWPNLKKYSNIDLSFENASGLLVPERVRSVIFSPLNFVDKVQKEMLLKARCCATQLSNRSALFVVNSIEDFPAQADGIILSWKGDIEKEIKLLNEIRKNYTGKIFAFMGKNFSLSDTHKRVLSISAFLKYKVYPLLPPDENIEILSHKEVVLFLWLKQHIDCINNDGIELTKLFPFPTAVHQKEFLQKKRYAINVYKASLIDVIKNEFLELKGSVSK